MSGWHQALAAADLAEGETLAALVAGRELALFRIDGALYATANTCPHGAARLSDGWLEGHVIECPLHQALFDVRGGQRLDGPACNDVQTFSARERDGWIEVELADS